MNHKNSGMRVEKRVALVALFLTTLAVVAFSVWAAPVLATWVITGRLAHIDYGHALVVALGSVLEVPHATRHWPRIVRAASRAEWRWWLTVGLLCCGETVAAATVLRWLDAIASQPVADRRFWQLRGISPRTFGRTHTIAPLLVDRRQADQIVIGTHRHRRLAVQKNVHLLIVAPPRSGKTAGIIIPALLDHAGPVISTSVRTDVRDRTLTRRSALGDVYEWDPFSQTGNSDLYDPIHGCKSWAHALRVARWLTSAVKLGSGGSQDYFTDEAENLLAPLIHAAAFARNGSICNVFDWLQTKNPDMPVAVLEQAGTMYGEQKDVQDGCAAAIARLESVFAYNPRQLDGLIGTARVMLKVYGDPKARATAQTWRAKNTGRRVLTPQALLGRRKGGEEPSNTLYIVADRDDQKGLAPIIVTMLSELVYYLDQQYNRGRELPVSAMFALDEAAQIAPLEDISRIMSASLPNSRFLTVWHSVSQIQDRYGQHAAREILALSQAKIYLGSNTDSETIGEVNRLIGQQAGDQTFNPEIQTAQALQRLRDDEGILVHTNLPPTVFRQRRYYQDRTLRHLADRPDQYTPPNDHMNAVAQATDGLVRDDTFEVDLHELPVPGERSEQEAA